MPNQPIQQNQKVVGVNQNPNQEIQQEKNKCCPFLTLPVMVFNKFTNKQEAQLKINLCIKDNCSLYVNGKCGLIKG